MKANMKIALLLIVFSYALPLASQSLDSLVHLEKTNLYFSKGYDKRAEEISRNINGALQYYNKVLHFKPEVTVLVLSQDDWVKHTTFPVYGMPHYTNDKTL